MNPEITAYSKTRKHLVVTTVPEVMQVLPNEVTGLDAVSLDPATHFPKNDLQAISNYIFTLLRLPISKPEKPYMIIKVR